MYIFCQYSHSIANLHNFETQCNNIDTNSGGFEVINVKAADFVVSLQTFLDSWNSCCFGLPRSHALSGCDLLQRTKTVNFLVWLVQKAGVTTRWWLLQVRLPLLRVLLEQIVQTWRDKCWTGAVHTKTASCSCKSHISAQFHSFKCLFWDIIRRTQKEKDVAFSLKGFSSIHSCQCLSVTLIVWVHQIFLLLNYLKTRVKTAHKISVL